MAQVYPPENGQGPARFRRWYLDEITGAMISEDRAVRDFNGRLRDADDVDRPGMDELMETYVLPTDADPEPLE